MRFWLITLLCLLLLVPFSSGISDELKGTAKSPIYTGIQPPDAMDDLVAKARQKELWIPALREVETIQIICEVSAENVKGGINLPLIPILASFFSRLGLRTATDENTLSDAKIKLNLNCRALGKTYPEGLLYMGAYVEGKVTFQAKDFQLEESFRGEVEPPDEIPEWQKSNIEQYKDPKNAPFTLALRQPGSLVEKLGRIYFRVFGKYALVIMYVEGDPIYGSPYYIPLDSLLKEIGEPLLEPFIYLLQSRIEGITLISAHALGVLKSPKAIPALISLAAKRFGEYEEVKNAILQCLREPGGTEQLLICLKSEDPRIRGKAVEFLRTIRGDKAVEGLLTALNDKSPEVRRIAVEAFTYIKDSRAVEPLIKILNNTYEKDEIRALAARALGEIGDERAIKPLQEILKWSRASYDLQTEASKALQKIPTPAMPLPQLLSKWRSAVEHNEKSEINNYEEQLKRRGPVVVDQLLPIVENEREKKGLRLSALKILCEFKDNRLIKPFLTIAQNEREGLEERKLAIKGLGINKVKEAANFLLALLTNNKEISTLRASAAIALGEIGEEKAIEPLFALMKTKPPRRVLEEEYDYEESPYMLYSEREDLRYPSALALAKIGNPALGRIMDALKDDDPQVRRIMIWALGEVKEDWAKNLIVSSIDDPDTDIVLSIANILVREKDPRAAEAILKVLDSETVDIGRKGEVIWLLGELCEETKGFEDRRFIEPLKKFLMNSPLSGGFSVEEAIFLLARFKDPSCVEAIGRFLYSDVESMREAAIDALREIGHIAPVIKDLAYLSKNDESASVRLGAVSLLALSSDPIAIRALCDAIKYDPDYSVQINAVDALLKWKPPEAVEPLALFLVKCKDQSVKSNVAKALSQIDVARAVQAIIPTLKDPDPKVRIGAAEALGLLEAKEGVEPLIDLLIDENKDVRESARNALKAIVHEDYGYDMGRWRVWWEEYKKRTTEKR
ncbi:HEAT repeat domain-containing protein [bacterium]|nr:HEAT repeat domain-containing protein [bacterium]